MILYSLIGALEQVTELAFLFFSLNRKLQMDSVTCYHVSDPDPPCWSDSCVKMRAIVIPLHTKLPFLPIVSLFAVFFSLFFKFCP